MICPSSTGVVLVIFVHLFRQIANDKFLGDAKPLWKHHWQPGRWIGRWGGTCWWSVLLCRLDFSSMFLIIKQIFLPRPGSIWTGSSAHVWRWSWKECGKPNCFSPCCRKDVGGYDHDRVMMDRVVVLTLMMMVLWKECDKPDEMRCENKTEIKLNNVIICLIHNIRPIYFVHF